MTNFISIIEKYNIIYQNIQNKPFNLTNDSLFQLAQRLVVKTPKIEINQEEWLNIFMDFTEDEVPNPYVLKMLNLKYYTPDVGNLIIEEITTSDQGMYGGSKKQTGGGKQNIHSEIMSHINVQKKIVKLPLRLVDQYSLGNRVTEIQGLLDYYNDLKNYREIFDAEDGDETIIDEQKYYTNEQTLLKIRLLFLELKIPYPSQTDPFSVVFANELMNYDKVFIGLKPVIDLLNRLISNYASAPAVPAVPAPSLGGPPFGAPSLGGPPAPHSGLNKRLPKRDEYVQTGITSESLALIGKITNFNEATSNNSSNIPGKRPKVGTNGGTNKTIKKRKHRKTIKRKRRKTNKKTKTIKRSYNKRKTRHAFAHHL
jgi:hypothetical protein